MYAGVIEPGHFRFQCHGEHVFHLEIALGYQHRGLERALVGGPSKKTMQYMPGCPPHPLAILDGLLRLLDRLPVMSR